VNALLQSGTSLLEDLGPLLESRDDLAALDLLRRGLTEIRSSSSPGQWRAFCADTFSGEKFRRHPLSHLLKNGPLAGSCHGAPTLIHDPILLDAIYGLDAVPQDLTSGANVLRSWELSLGFCESLRARHQCLIRELNELGDSVRSPRVLALGCGHLREAAPALCLNNMCGGELVAFDRDPVCIDLIEGQYDYPGLCTFSGSLRHLIHHPALGRFDLVYLATLSDILEDLRLKSLLESLLPLLRPGGRLLSANFCPGLEDAAYLEARLDWWPIYRDEEEWAELLSELQWPNLRGQAVFRDSSEGSVFIDLQVS
jgi:SAM-dependent methyltransferase